MQPSLPVYYKQTQEKKSTLRCASLRGVEFFPVGKEERGGAAQGGFLLLSLFTYLVETRTSSFKLTFIALESDRVACFVKHTLFKQYFTSSNSYLVILIDRFFPKKCKQ